MAACQDPRRFSEALLHHDDLDEESAALLRAHLAACRPCEKRYERLLRAERIVRNLLRDAMAAHPPTEALYDYAEAPCGVPLDGDRRESIRAHLQFCRDCAWLVERARRATVPPRRLEPAAVPPRRLRRLAPFAAAAGLLLLGGPSGREGIPWIPIQAATVRSVPRLAYPNPEAVFASPLLFPGLAWTMGEDGEAFEVTLSEASAGPGAGLPIWRRETSSRAIRFEDVAREMTPGALYVATVACLADHPDHRADSEIVLDPDWSSSLSRAREALEEWRSPAAARTIARTLGEAERLPERAIALALAARLEGTAKARRDAIEAFDQTGANGSEQVLLALEELASALFGP